MQFFATVKIDPDTQQATPTLRVKHEMPKGEGGVTDIKFYDALKSIPARVKAALAGLPEKEGNCDIWIDSNEDGGKTVHSIAHFGDQEQSHGTSELGFIRERIIEVMTENTDNWSRKPGGCWTFDREFGMEEFEP